MIERTTRLSTLVHTLPEAWEFVMTSLDELHAIHPSITISPYSYTDESGAWCKGYEAVVSGTAEVRTDARSQP